MTATTPLRKQYLDIKRRHTDALLLFRIGDFYEAFDEDARILARELDIVLTSKPMGKSTRVPLAGVPYHSLERHLATLIARGHRVAICEQLSTTPVKGETGKNLMERDVVRVVTPGTVIEPGLLETKANNFLAAYTTDGKRAGIAYADVTTGEFAATELEAADAIGELQRIAPSELLVSIDGADADSDALPGFVTRCQATFFEYESARRVLLSHFKARSLAPFGLQRSPLAAAAAGAIISYLNDSQVAAAGQLVRLTSYHTDNFMMLDQRTFRSLEIFETASETGTLLGVLDRTRTAMGARLLRRWLRQPLLEVAEIVRRQEHVAWFHTHRKGRGELFAALDSMHDLERLSARARAQVASAQELLALGQSLETIPRIRSVLQKDTRRFGTLLSSLPLCEATATLIRGAIRDELPTRATDSIGVIRQGFSEELDRLRELLRNGRAFLAEMEQRERARTGIKSLRVGYNKVFGYFIEVTRPNLHLVPEDYTRKQTLTQGERFVTLELKEYESLVIHAQERITELETNLFRHLCIEIGKSREEILSAASAIAYLDTVASLADVADEFNYARPAVIDSPQLIIREGRHPVLERAFGGEEFVANDSLLGGEAAPQIAIITGPNMSGKSTYLRQTALIVLMAQVGSFVPAREATVGLCDRIFTRIGLYDRIGSGESTFMTEMIETAQILHHATPRSLILLDELGRGTSTYDGLAVARSVLEYIHNHPQIQSKTLFATHYHELTELVDTLPRLKNLHVEIVEEGSELVFLYKIREGSALKSYGVYAARLAGLPRPVVRRAEVLLGEYESEIKDARGLEATGYNQNASQSSRHAELTRALLDTDPNALSPVEALMKLFELRKLAEKEDTIIRAIKTA
jgi:DNA mismatch repair protein MutS